MPTVTPIWPAHKSCQPAIPRMKGIPFIFFSSILAFIWRTFHKVCALMSALVSALSSASAFQKYSFVQLKDSWVPQLCFIKMPSASVDALKRAPTDVQGSRYLCCQRFIVLYFRVCPPSLISPSPLCGAEQNRHWTFDIINTWPPVHISRKPLFQRGGRQGQFSHNKRGFKNWDYNIF